MTHLDADKTSIRVRTDNDAVAARQTAMQLCLEQGFDRTGAWELAMVVSELATSLAKRGGSGIITMRAVHDGEKLGVEVATVDRDPALASETAQAMPDPSQEGHDRAPELGQTLETVRRLTDACFVDSEPQRGTRVIATKWKKTQAPEAEG